MILFIAQLGSLFTTPALAAAGAIAVSIPIAIHLLSRLRRQRQPWGAMRFLLEAMQAHRRRLQLEQWVLLILRCLIVGLLGLALAGPVLSGCSGSRGRVVHLVLDDSLSSRASVGGDQIRFHELQRYAEQLIDGLLPEDRVQIWRGARPASPVTESPSTQHSQAKTEVAKLVPRWSRSDVNGALQQVVVALQSQGTTRGEAVVMVLSDWSGGGGSGGTGGTHSQRGWALGGGRPVDAGVIKQLSGLGSLWVTRPMGSEPNLQLSQLKPRRNMVVVEADGSASVAVTLEATRFGDSSRSVEALSVVSLQDDRGQIVAEVERKLVWSIGQHRVKVHVDLPVGPSEVGRSLIVRAQLDAAPSVDALQEDNIVYAVVTIHQQLTVGLVTTQTREASVVLSPTKWLELALSPTDQGALAVQRLSPQQMMQPQALSTLDAVMVLCPDRLSETAWKKLAEYTSEGALVWIWPAATSSEATWSTLMRRAFALEDWVMGWETAESDTGWSVTSQVTPRPLRLLSADLEMLQQPIRVWRRLPMTVPGGASWMGVSGGDEEGTGITEVTLPKGGGALIASAAYGLGELIVSAVALDMEWTNLPAKPLFVPLLHETLRSVLGEQRGQHPAVVAGSGPELGLRWSGVSSLQRLAIDGIDAVDQTIPLIHEQAGTTPAVPLTYPGVFTATDRPALKLAVNVDATAGDLTPVDVSRLSLWFGGTGEGGMMNRAGENFRGGVLDRRNPVAALEQSPRVARLGWALLWCVVVLVVLETILARWLSHARAPSQDSLSHRLLKKLAAMRHETSTVSRKRAAP